MNAHQRRRERRRIQRSTRNDVLWARWYEQQGNRDAAVGCAVTAIEHLAATRAFVPGKRVAWWVRGGRSPEGSLTENLRAIGREASRCRRRLGWNWRQTLAEELGVTDLVPGCRSVSA